MFLMVIAILIIIALSISAAYQISLNNRYSVHMALAAEKKGLVMVKESVFSFPTLNGLVNGHPVSLYKKSISYGKSTIATLAFDVTLLNAAIPAFTISAEGFISGVRQLFGKNDIQTGDGCFDAKILVASIYPDRILALLNKSARFMIMELMRASFSDHFRISEAKIEQYIKLTDLKSENDIIRNLERLLKLADLLCRGGNTVTLTIENFMTETDNAAKKRLLMMLYSAAARFKVNDPLMKKALNDPDKVVQFYGARLLDRGSDGDGILKNLYAMGNNALKTMIIKHLTADGNAGFLDYFLLQAQMKVNTAINIELAAYFAGMGNAGVEPFLRQELIACLDRNYSGDLTYTRALIRALETCGTFESIEPLYNIKHFTLKRDVEHAIAAIQGRIGTGGSGWLSLSKADNTDGNLSLSDEHKEVP